MPRSHIRLRAKKDNVTDKLGRATIVNRMIYVSGRRPPMTKEISETRTKLYRINVLPVKGADVSDRMK